MSAACDHGRVRAAVVLAVMLTAGHAHAEAEEGLCALPKAYPACRVNLLFDVGIRTKPIGKTPGEGSSPLSSTLELGFMINFAPATSIAISGGWSFDADYPAGLFRPRYRYWPHRYLALEASAGVLIKRGDELGVPGAGALFELAVTLSDIVGVTATLERWGDTTLAMFGVRFGFGALVGPAVLCPNCH